MFPDTYTITTNTSAYIRVVLVHFVGPCGLACAPLETFSCVSLPPPAPSFAQVSDRSVFFLDIRPGARATGGAMDFNTLIASLPKDAFLGQKQWATKKWTHRVAQTEQGGAQPPIFYAVVARILAETFGS